MTPGTFYQSCLISKWGRIFVCRVPRPSHLYTTQIGLVYRSDRMRDVAADKGADRMRAVENLLDGAYARVQHCRSLSSQ